MTSGNFNKAAALRIYFEKSDIGTKEICEIFGCAPNGTRVRALKAAARARMLRDSVKPYKASDVNTKCAYIEWNIDIDELERDYRRCKKVYGEERAAEIWG